MLLARSPPCFCLATSEGSGLAMNEDFLRNVLEPEAQTGENASLLPWWEIELHEARRFERFALSEIPQTPKL